MKKRIVFILAIIALAGFLSAQIPTIIPVGPIYQTLILLRGARIKAGQYLNFGPTYGTAGYGIYDNAGTLQYKNSGGAWANLGAGGATTFLALTDTPAAYTAAGGYLVRVNAGANALEFVAGSGSLVGLGSVENTAISTWAGSANVTTLGTIGTGTWNATAIADGKIDSALTGKSYNGLTLTALATGFSLAGGTTSKTLTVELNSYVNQDLTTDASPTHTGLTLGSAAANGILNLYGLHASGYFNIIKGSNAEGLAGADLRIGLDETNRTLIVCDRLDVDTDIGLSAQTLPTLQIFNPTPGNGNLALQWNALTCTYSGLTSNAYSFWWNATTDKGAGDMYTVTSNSGIELTDTDARQSWLAVYPKVNQSGTAAYDGIYVNATNTGLGTGATGEGNNLLNLTVSGVSMYRQDIYGHGHGGESASLADTVAMTTHIADTWVGQITVTTSDGYCAIYRLDGTALTAISANTIFTNTKGTDAKWNVYIETNVVKVENQMGGTFTAKALFIGY